ncbi:winged helix-turn-helix domain-containing protein [Erythrobacter sp.]|uniref:winged helix-turn-helix domain-containing protein n=1 Tax=Erythrobacter sp. TaxID=1042 RepID=UPI001425E80F|nr:winged helix-turn-helix domain-containing protein [Erythrobacter sp.]QIQ87952.1 MAG: response regulator transcription factor [Erythrobacter sp.]
MTEHEPDPQFPAADTHIPRFREAGEVTLDLVNRDGRVADRWLGFRPREFEVLWRLAEQPGERMTRRQLLQGVWRLGFDREGRSLSVLVARIRAKLAPFGLSQLVASHAQGGYFLDPATCPCAFDIALAPSA